MSSIGQKYNKLCEAMNSEANQKRSIVVHGEVVEFWELFANGCNNARDTDYKADGLDGREGSEDWCRIAVGTIEGYFDESGNWETFKQLLAN